MIKFQKLNKHNYSKVLEIKNKLFPESNSNEDYEKYFNNEGNSNYYLILIDKTPCGTIGWYDFDNNNIDAFIGWFGISPEYQNQGIGRKALNFIINEIQSLNFKYVRVYTDKAVNYISTKLYDKSFDFCENYTYPDKLGKTNSFVVYTKCLTSKCDK